MVTESEEAAEQADVELHAGVLTLNCLIMKAFMTMASEMRTQETITASAKLSSRL